MHTQDRAGRGGNPAGREDDEKSQTSDVRRVADQRAHFQASKNPNAYFDALTHDEKLDAIRRMERDGYSAYSIASATRLSVEAVRALLEPPAELRP